METTNQNPTKKKPGCWKRIFRFVIFCVVILSAAYLTCEYGVPYYTTLHDRYAYQEPEWAIFDPQDTEFKFALFRINHALVGGSEELKTENAFFLNRMSLYGEIASMEECQNTKYRCGDENWKPFDGDSMLLDNRCMVKIDKGSFCNILLPDGTLINATNQRINYSERLHGFEKFFATDDLIFQIVMNEGDIVIKQGLTYQESMLWYVMSPVSDYSYSVEIGDQIIKDIGTSFGTVSSMKNKLIAAAVKQGSIQVSGYHLANPLNVYSGSYLRGSVYNTSTCPVGLKACGDSCVPGNAECCSPISDSYCLSPLKCGNNYSGQCTAGLFFSEQSNYCCISSNAFADEINIFKRGSYDCPEGKKHCGMACIPEDQPCCYPTENDCVENQIETYEVKTLTDDINIPRAYLNEKYAQLLGTPSFQEMLRSPDLLSDLSSLVDVRTFIIEELREKFEADAAASNPNDETKKYCARFPSLCTTKKNSSSSSDSSGNCPSTLPSDLVCSCNSRDSRGWVFCGTNADGMGSWVIPLSCLQSHGICR